LQEKASIESEGASSANPDDPFAAEDAKEEERLLAIAKSYEDKYVSHNDLHPKEISIVV
jgi:hypothetical protein